MSRILPHKSDQAKQLQWKFIIKEEGTPDDK